MDHSTHDLTANLNPAQRDAVTHLGSPLMIIAGAGSGKTRVITHRIAFLVREVGIPLFQVMAVTFTNKAAREMRERVVRLLGMSDSPGLPIGTFHSRCAMILRRDADAAHVDSNFAILDERDQLQAVKAAMKVVDVSDKRVKPSQIQNFINTAKMRLLTPDDTREEFDHDEIPYPDLYRAYEALLEKSNSLDYEDLIFRVVRLFQNDEAARRRWASRYRYLLVDEYQDTNHGQFLLTKLLAEDHKQVAVVGDEDQSIYSWRGAEISNLLDFEKAFPGTRIVKLEQNYRSHANILKAASHVIARNTQRIGKTLFTDLDDGPPLEYILGLDETHEAEFVTREISRLSVTEDVSLSDVAVFYRSHRLSRAVEDQLRRMRIPYRVVGGIRFYDRQEIKDLLSFLRLAVNPNDNLAFERVVNVPRRGVGDKALSDVIKHGNTKGLSLSGAAADLLRVGGIRGTARTGLERFLLMLDGWAALDPGMAPVEVLRRVLADTRYKEEAIGDADSIDGRARLENIEELESMMEEFVPSDPEGHLLAQFLNDLSLDATEEEDPDERLKPKVSLMSVHNAKGLEFDTVFLVGMSDGVFPNSRAMEAENETGLEEERRLFYVAITRARKRLYLSRPSRRMGAGFYEPAMASRFLMELPPEVLSSESRARLRRDLPKGWDQPAKPTKASPAAPAGIAERTYEPDPEAEPPRGAFGRHVASAGSRFAPPPPRADSIGVGSRVIHKYLGAGAVVRASGAGAGRRVGVRFDSGGEQDFILRWAPLTLEKGGSDA